MKNQRYRYIGTKPYNNSDKDIFFGRENESAELYQAVSFEKTTILHSESGAGKSSLLKANTLPLLADSKQFEVIYIDIPLNNNTKKPIDFLLEKLHIYKDVLSYVDKVFDDKNSIWYYLKKVQSNDELNDKTVIIIDSYENLFSYKENDIVNFNAQLSEILYENLPENFKNTIKQKLSKNPDLLTNQALVSMFGTLNISILFSINSANTSNLKKLIHFFPDIEKSIIEISYFTENQSKEVMKKASEYVSNYKEKNNFVSENFKISEDAQNFIINKLSDENELIKPYDLQIVCSFIEKYSISNKKKNIGVEDIKDIDNIFYKFYKNSLQNIENKEIRNEVAKIIEQNLILEEEEKTVCLYNGFINSKHKIPNEIFDILIGVVETKIRDKKDIYRKIHSQNMILPIIKVKNERTKFHEQIKEEQVEANEIKRLAEIQTQKAKRLRSTFFVSILATVTLLVAIFFIYKAKKQAQKSEVLAKSNLFAALSFQNLENDNTLSFRYAEQAYKLNNTNTAAYTALVNSYYSAEAFYSIIRKVEQNTLESKISKSGKYILSVVKDENEKAHILKLEEVSGKNIFKITNEFTIVDIEFSPDEKMISITDKKGFVRLFDFAGKEILRIKAFEHQALHSQISPDMKHILVSGGAGNSVSLWDFSGKKLVDLPKHDFFVVAARFSPDGKYIATSDDGVLNICNIHGKLLHSYNITKTNTYYKPIVQDIIFSNDSKKIMLAINDMLGNNNIIKVIDIQGNERAILRGHTDWINSIHFSDDNSEIVSSSRDKTIIVWDSLGEVLGVLKGHKANIDDAVFQANTSNVISISDDKTIRKWEFGRVLNPLSKLKNIDLAKFSTDGLNILIARDTLISLIDLLGDEKMKFIGNKKAVNSIDFSSNGKLVVSAGKDKSIRVWDINGKLISEFKKHTKKINSVKFMPDSNIILSTSNDKSAILWEVGKKEAQKVFSFDAKINFADFSPDKKSIIFALSNGKIIIKDISGKEILNFEAHKKKVISARFSPNGKFFISNSKDKTVKLWNLEGKLLQTITDFDNNINSVEFSSNSKYILTASNDNSVKLYDFQANEIAKFKQTGKIINSSFSPDGKYIVSVIQNSKGKHAKVQVISPDKILELVNEVKIFGNFYKLK